MDQTIFLQHEISSREDIPVLNCLSKALLLSPFFFLLRNSTNGKIEFLVIVIIPFTYQAEPIKYANKLRVNIVRFAAKVKKFLLPQKIRKNKIFKLKVRNVTVLRSEDGVSMEVFLEDLPLSVISKKSRQVQRATNHEIEGAEVFRIENFVQCATGYANTTQDDHALLWAYVTISDKAKDGGGNKTWTCNMGSLEKKYGSLGERQLRMTCSTTY
ncbi:hypothetical protein Lal_00026561 [Lupinus albus]|nr:hypothetical protein Lal_00026561 [Lupinus albus]